MNMKVTPKQYATVLYEMTKDATKAQLKEAVKSFLQMLVKGRALPMLPRILQMYEDYYNRKEGIVDVEVVSGRSIPTSVPRTLKTQLSEKMNVELTLREDPSVLGGARIRVGDWMVDDTLKARLNAVRGKMKYAR